MAERRPYKRRNYMINPRFQLRFMAYVVLAVLLSLTALYLSNAYYFDGLVAQGEDIGLDPSHPYYELIQQQRKRLMQTYLVVSLVVFILLISSALLLSHRIAGPLYHIARVMKLIIAQGSGNARVHLRKGDFFIELEDVVNELISYFEGEADLNTRLALEHLRDATAVRSLRGARILLVEDSGINQQLTTELLHSNGVAVVTVDSGLRALDLLAVDPDFDGILMDDQMPEMDGDEATARIRALPGFEKLPIISISAHIKATGLARAQDAGMNDHVGKPIAARELFSVLAKWITPAHPIDESDDDSDAGSLATIEGIDTGHGLLQAHHNQTLYFRLLRRFLETQSHFSDAFLTAMRNAGPDDAAREAHTLARVAGNIGASGIADRARALERACQQGATLDDLTDELAELAGTIDSVLKGIETATAGWDTDHRSLSPAEYTRMLSELLALVRARDKGAQGMLQILIDRSPEGVASQLARLMTALEANDFEQAESLIGMLVESP